MGLRRFWTGSARKHGLSHKASWSDRYAIELETREVAGRLEDGDTVLDAGCGNGFTAFELASRKDVRICGIDLIPEMVRNARKRLKGFPALAERLEFKTGDIKQLPEKDGTYDKVVAIRVFINLANAADRLNAFRECARVLRPGGRLLLSEATVEGWKKLNRFRKEWGLEAVPMPVFNHYLDEKGTVRLASRYFRLSEIRPFSSTYFVGTRVLKPVLIRALGLRTDPADPLSLWNEWFSKLPAWGDFGTQKLFVFEKK